jgi:UMF1 family MFS transporter
VLGRTQALRRSLFSQLIPPGQEAEYFGFYEISERGTSWIGPIVFAVAVQLTGSQRLGIVSLIIFFVAGLLLLTRVNIRQAIVEAGHDPTGVV